MESGVPMLNCLLQHTLRSLCYTCTDSSSSKWIYAVFWKILPRNYPPPKWDYGGGVLDRSKKNKSNWILVWEDGYCNFHECEKAGRRRRFGADVFFKMSHEVYCFGEGLMGNVAAENSQKWVFCDSTAETDSSLLTSWNAPIDIQPRAWKNQFHSGIQTIAVISVREGLIQLGSFEKINEDLNLVISIQNKFSYLLSLPGFYAIQRPTLHLPIQNHHNHNHNHKEINIGLDVKTQLIGRKRIFDGKLDEFHFKSLNLGYKSPKNRPQIWPIPPLFPSTPCSFGTLLSKLPLEGVGNDDDKGFDIKTEPFCVLEDEEKERPLAL